MIKNNFLELPTISYDHRALKYDPVKKLQEFKELRLKIIRDLGDKDPLGLIMMRNCMQYEDVIRMLMARGTNDFYNYSKNLYGSANEVMGDGKTKLSDLAHVMSDLLNTLDEKISGENFNKTLTSQDVVDQLKDRLGEYFKGEKIKVKLSDGIISDASAGSDYNKIKSEVTFCKKDLDIFEVHEGWVHLGTTLNG
ncbi:MAG: flavohemoglobin expression-modulating QEGLA motif protein, partial [Bdellovibrionales bacterium]|nr:flavohemoglobin expression-modulating QEGLA motif protein [Bdellovibrionales bacterium]